MSSMTSSVSRKRLHIPDFRDENSSDSEDYTPPLKLRREYESPYTINIKNKLREFAVWISDLRVKDFFSMAIKSGASIPDDAMVIRDDDEELKEEEDEDDDIEIQAIKVNNPDKLAPLIEKYKNTKLENDSRHSRRQFEINGSYPLSYGTHRINGTSSQSWKYNGNFSSRQLRTDNLKRPALISNPRTDIEILLGSKSEVSVPETDEIEILSELPSTKKKSSSQKSARLSSRSSAAKHSDLTRSHTSSVKKLSQSSALKSFTANEVVRLQEKEQYKLLLEKYISGSYYRHVAKKPQSDAGVQANSSLLGASHFKKEVLHQPIDNFVQKYVKPCRLVTSEKAGDKKKEPTEIKIDDNDDDDDIQILDVKLPVYKSKFENYNFTAVFPDDWLSDLKKVVHAQAQERLKLVQDHEQQLERIKKERLLSRLKIDAQTAEPEFPELTPEMEEAVEQAWNTGAPNDQLCRVAADYLLRKDIETLNGLNWLNDSIINGYFDLIVGRSTEAGYPKVHAYNTFFYSTYKTKGYQSVRRWTRKIDIFNFDLNFVPIHLGVHWCLAVIDHRSKKICYYDSMGTGEEQCLDLLHDYLCLEYKDKKGQILDPSIYTTEIMKDIPQQMNGSDCGMFTLKYAEYISRDAEITFNQSHMQYFRRRMVYEFLTGQLL